MRFLLTILLTVSLMLNLWLYFGRKPYVKETKVEVVKTDTVIEWKYSTDTVRISETRYKDRYIYDTIHHNNTVYVKDTLHSYSFDERNYTLDINAVRLENYRLDIHAKDTVTVPTTIYKTEIKPVRNKISVGVIGGYGYGFGSKTVEPFVGLGVSINLF